MKKNRICFMIFLIWEVKLTEPKKKCKFKKQVKQGLDLLAFHYNKKYLDLTLRNPFNKTQTQIIPDYS
jgi:hypothetical protein